MGWGAGVLIVVAILVAGFGVLSLSNATLGVGLLCSAVALLILARISQADRHHRQVLERLGARTMP